VTTFWSGRGSSYTCRVARRGHVPCMVNYGYTHISGTVDPGFEPPRFQVVVICLHLTLKSIVMSRRSYEAFRAGKTQSGLRIGSYQEYAAFSATQLTTYRSETDAESLASYSTRLTSSSYITNSSIPSRLAPYRRTASSSTTNQDVPASSPSPSNSIPPYTSHLDIPRTSNPTKSRRRHSDRTFSTLQNEVYNSPLRRYTRYMSQSSQSHLTLPLSLIAVGLIKVGIGFGGFSGKDSPPMYGDFEAQRHWMEVTLGKGLREWYTYREDWWLLDCESIHSYRTRGRTCGMIAEGRFIDPPLTAYTSWICGYM
jgi:hypothetical protein